MSKFNYILRSLSRPLFEFPQEKSVTRDAELRSPSFGKLDARECSSGPVSSIVASRSRSPSQCDMASCRAVQSWPRWTGRARPIMTMIANEHFNLIVEDDLRPVARRRIQRLRCPVVTTQDKVWSRWGSRASTSIVNTIKCFRLQQWSRTSRSAATRVAWQHSSIAMRVANKYVDHKHDRVRRSWQCSQTS